MTTTNDDFFVKCSELFAKGLTVLHAKFIPQVLKDYWMMPVTGVKTMMTDGSL